MPQEKRILTEKEEKRTDKNVQIFSMMVERLDFFFFRQCGRLIFWLITAKFDLCDFRFPSFIATGDGKLVYLSGIGDGIVHCKAKIAKGGGKNGYRGRKEVFVSPVLISFLTWAKYLRRGGQHR